MFGFFNRREFIDWPAYKEKVDFIDEFSFQQDVRLQSIRNLSL